MCIIKNPIIPLIKPKSIDGRSGKKVSEARRGGDVVNEIGRGSVWRRGVNGVGWSYQG
jgi:hypothetical protein